MVTENQKLKPILKWVGGKRWLVPKLYDIWSEYNHLTLVEPFTGGMSVALGLIPNKAILNDANPHLINLYKQVKKGLDFKHRFQNTETYYYNKRDQFNKLIINNKVTTKESAALFFYLIKTGFNGLCRFNNRGIFNVPFGQHKSINYKIDLSIYKNLFNNWNFQNKDFEKLKLDGKEFLYVDPPYDVEFTKYHQQDFTFKDQIRLIEWLAKHKGPIVASNQATKRMIDLYRRYNFQVTTINAPRRVSCDGNREPALEMLAFKNIDNKFVVT